MDPSSREEVAIMEKNTLLNISILNAKKTQTVTKQQWYLPKRYIVTFLLFLGMTISYLMRSNLSIALVDMTSEKTGRNGTMKKAEFDWNTKEKGIILSLAAVGAMFAPFGGLISRKFGGATTYGLAITVTGLLTLLTPLFLYFHLWVFGVVRILEGLLQAVSLPGYVEVLVRWAPPEERSRLVLMPSVGIYLGSVFGYQLSGFLAKNYNWQSIFYVTGFICLIWYAFWVLLVSNRPSEDRWISEDELNYLNQVIPDRSKEKKISQFPYKTILTSPPVWAYINEYFSWGWIHSFFLSGLPLFVKDVYNVNVQKVGIISSIPLICGVIGLTIAPFLADYLRSKKILKVPTVHRIFITIGQCSAITFLLLIGLWANFEQTIICFSLLKFWASFTETSNTVLPIDMFAGYASFINGLAITASCVSHMLNPTIMGFIASDKSRARWNLYFLFICIFNVWSTLVFYLFGSGERQPWATTEKIDENRKEEQDLPLKETVA